MVILEFRMILFIYIIHIKSIVYFLFLTIFCNEWEIVCYRTQIKNVIMYPKVCFPSFRPVWRLLLLSFLSLLDDYHFIHMKVQGDLGHVLNRVLVKNKRHDTKTRLSWHRTSFLLLFYLMKIWKQKMKISEQLV